jgi:putative Mg2+ transporter-C (MgtC) family protein
MVNRINRQPLDTASVEVTNTVYVIAPRARQKEALKRLEAALEAAQYPVRDPDMHAFGEDAAEIEAVLASTFVDGEHLDALVAQLSALDCISQTFWSPSTID